MENKRELKRSGVKNVRENNLMRNTKYIIDL